MAFYDAATPEDVPGSGGVPECDWCGEPVFDRDAEAVLGRRLCRIVCVAAFREMLGDDESEDGHGCG